MPGFDRSGPTGSGSMTGLARGMCNPAGSTETPGMPSQGGRRGNCRRGMRGGRGRGMGQGGGYGQPPADRFAAPQQQAGEKENLEAQENQLKQSLKEIQLKLEALENNE